MGQLKRVFIPLGLLSAITNFAVLISPIYMIQVLDRVVPSQNLNTLVLLLLVALAFVALQSIVDFVRDTAFDRTARWVEAISIAPILRQNGGNKQQNIDDLNMVSNALKGSVGPSLLNVPWLPLFMVALVMVHVWFALLAVVIIALQFGLRALGMAMRQSTERQRGQLQSLENQALANSANFFAAAGMHVLSRNLTLRYASFQEKRHTVEDALTPGRAVQNAATGFVRTATQLLGLSLGATLVVMGDLTAGGMIAASIILAKTTTTFETTLNAIPDMRATLVALARLDKVFAATGNHQTTIADLSGALSCQNLVFPRGNGAPPRLEKVSFALEPGECLAILGASGSGKSTLLSALAGIQPAPIGSVLFDETEVKSVSVETATQHLGYLPQQAQLFSGTLAENICSFDPNPNDERIVEVAKTAGVHGLISALPNSYDTNIGDEPHLLSAGQKQRIALARAIYNMPRYLFLDEPNALLDADGERQMGDALARLKSQGTTVVMVIHRSGVMGLADKILHLDHGRVTDFGPRAEVLARFNVGIRRLEVPLQDSSVQDLTDWVGRQFVRTGDAPFRERAILVATELMTVAIANGPQDRKRIGVFEFTFFDDDHCELKLSEGNHTVAAQKVAKVADLMRRADVDMSKLAKDEVSLAVLGQIASDVSIKNVEGGAVFRTAIENSSATTPNIGAPH
ncbi:MAG: ATP-binding cassette domain-containing protein [Pseudomonadota bacterium]